MSIEKQKQIADEILYKLELICPYVILAGGAPRDWYLGYEANDLDFYFTSLADTCSATKQQLDRVFDGYISDIQVNNYEDWDNSLYKTMPNLVRIFNASVDGVKVQFIQLTKDTNMFNVVDTMDVSICKAYYKGGKIGITNEFKLTIASNIMFPSEGYSWSEKHGQKMIERFKNKFHAGTKEQAVSSLLSKTLKEFN